MYFALLGDHEDGLALARALAESGRYRLRCYSGSAVGAELLRRWELMPQIVVDLEEILADPLVEAVIVAGPPASRPALLRRALQSERHVLCVHPADQRPDLAYEAASIQRETGCVLLPLLPEAFHPGLERLAKLIALERAEHQPGAEPPALPRLIKLERWSSDNVLLDAGVPGHEPGFPCWDMLRALAGEIVEVSAFANLAEVRPEDPLLLAGRFEKGGLFHATFLPNQPHAWLRLTVMLHYGQAELIFPDGWPGPARLTWPDEHGRMCEEDWDAWNPWPCLVEVFEQTLARHPVPRPLADKYPERVALPLGLLTWEDEVRGLELDDAARRSVERRRSSTLEFQEDFEDASFKGTMTLFGCALLWISLLLLILSYWLPWLGWLILPLFAFFLLLQLLRGIILPKEAPSAPPKEAERAERN